MVLLPIDVAQVLGFTHEEFNKLPAGKKKYYARKVYQSFLVDNIDILPDN